MAEVHSRDEQQDEFYTTRQGELGRMQQAIMDYKAKMIDYDNSVDAYNTAVTEILCSRPRLKRLLPMGTTSSGQSKRSISSRSASGSKEESLQKVLDSVVQLVETSLSHHTDDHQQAKAIFGRLEKLLNRALALEKQNFNDQQTRLRELRVPAGCRDYVGEFRFEVYLVVCKDNPDVESKHSTMDSYLSAMADEFRRFKSRHIRARPLHKMFADAINKLGLSLDEWKLVKGLGQTSNENFHTPFTRAQLETTAFPPEMEKYRQPLLKVAKKLDELKAAAGDDDDAVGKEEDLL
jgi:hypothetical protein